MQKRHFPTHDFETIKVAFNRWRSDFAPGLTRDEAVRYALGEWLTEQGYLPTPPDEPSARDQVTDLAPGTLSGAGQTINGAAAL